MQERWGIPVRTVKGFCMKPRSYYARALGVNRDMIIVIESLKPILPYNKIREAITSEKWQRIFGALQEKLGHITLAKRRGL